MSHDRHSVEYILTTGHHVQLGISVDMLVPAAAKHRSAVKAFLAGKYFEPFSHLSYSRILQRASKKNVVHAGAFFGDMLHTLSVFAERVYAFEPVLDNYIIARLNLDKLGLDNVILMNGGLGAATSVARIVTTTAQGEFRGGASSFRLKVENLGSVRTELTPIFKLDDLSYINNVGLLHLDVEGFELPVLQGALKLIKKYRPVILLEDNLDVCGPLLGELGYSFVFRKEGLSYWGVSRDLEFLKSLTD